MCQSPLPAILGVLLISLCSGCGMGSQSDIAVGPGSVSQASPMWRELEKQALPDPPFEAAKHRQRQNFLILRSPYEQVPANIRTHISRTTGAPESSVDLETGQHIQEAGRDIWIVNARPATCMVEGSDGGVACAPAFDFAMRGLSLGTAMPPSRPDGPPQGFHLLGIAPDWMQAVQVKIGRRKTRSISVQGNAYGMRSAAPIFLVGFCKRLHEDCQHFTRSR